jgi:hypothetical protein
MSIKTAICTAFLASAALSACAGDHPQSTRAYNEGYASGCHTGNGSSVLTGSPAAEGEKLRFTTDGNFQAGWKWGNSLCHEKAQLGPGEG